MEIAQYIVNCANIEPKYSYTSSQEHNVVSFTCDYWQCSKQRFIHYLQFLYLTLFKYCLALTSWSQGGNCFPYSMFRHLKLAGSPFMCRSLHTGPVPCCPHTLSISFICVVFATCPTVAGPSQDFRQHNTV